MNMNQITDKDHATAMFTLAAERVELMFYREQIPGLTQKVTELEQEHGGCAAKIAELEMMIENLRKELDAED